MKNSENDLGGPEREEGVGFQSTLFQLTSVIDEAVKRDEDTGATFIALSDGWEVVIGEEGGDYTFRGASLTTLLREATEYLRRKHNIPENLGRMDEQIALPELRTDLEVLKRAAITRGCELGIVYTPPEADDEEPWEMIWQGADEFVVGADSLDQLVYHSLAFVTPPE